jgi:hypothetical protein
LAVFLLLWKEEKVKKYSHDDALTTSASALLDHGAEVFIQASGTLDQHKKELEGKKSQSRRDEFDWI